MNFRIPGPVLQMLLTSSTLGGVPWTWLWIFGSIGDQVNGTNKNPGDRAANDLFTIFN